MSKPKISYKIVTLGIFVIYLVGSAGFLKESLKPLFESLTKWTLLASLLLLFFYHKNDWNRKTIIVFIFIALSSFIVEYIGVNTGLIFGNYEYGKGLGIQLGHTPILIAMNWLMLTYAISSIIFRFPFTTNTKALIGAGFMITYDWVLEQVAPFLDLWYWENNTVPIQNYIAWYLLSFLYIQLLLRSKTVLANSVALPIVLAQWMFFMLLFIFAKFSL